jgi:photosystem II stability/assembly factor-like uncharacterized protein
MLQGLQYRMVGPHRGGRVTTVTGVRQQPLTFYFGSTGGGVWRTTNAGLTWENVSDKYFEVGSMGAIDVADSDPSVLYAGTGSEGLRSNVSTGRGIYKSTDGAKTWAHVGLREMGQLGAVVIHPTNPDVVFVAALGQAFGPSAERGVYRTTDGGKTWKQVLFVSDSTGAVDVIMTPGNPRELYAAMWRAERKPWTIVSGAREGGIYKSSDGGDSWTKLTNGLPTALVGKGDLSISPANPRRVYALLEASEGQGGLYRSDDAGGTWTHVNRQRTLVDRPFYYINVHADPKNADVVYVNNEAFFKSTDAGKTFQRLRVPHGDNHDMWINPDNPDVFIQSNDGGVNVTQDGGKSWSTQYNQPTAELYQVAVDDQWPYRLYGAQQDNSTIVLPSLPTTATAPDSPLMQWLVGPGCETGPITPKPGDPTIIYGACKGQFSRMNLKTGQEKHYWVGGQFMYGHNPKDLKFRFQRVSPIEVSPHDPRVIYHGSQFVHRSADEGATWTRISPDLTANEADKQVVSGAPITRDITGEEFYSTLYAIEESPLERGVIWAGSNDGPVHVTRDGGRTWTNVTPKDLPAGGRVQTIDASPHRRGSAYVAVYRYMLDDWAPYIYRTDDYGRSWTRLTSGTNGIPADHPTRVIREDPTRQGLLYAGTEFGMWVSFDNGGRWQELQGNLPHTPITDIEVHRKDLVLSTMGRGFWILDDISPLQQMSARVAAAPSHLFEPRPAYRLRYSGYGMFSGVDPAQFPQYVDPGATIYYSLASAPAGEVTIDILDRAGAVVRSFSSAAAGERAVEPEAASMRAPRMERVGTPALAKTPGLHRFVWDLAHPGPWSPDTNRSGREGPMVAPGRYRVRLSAGGVTTTRPLDVRMDPRVGADVAPADVAQQVAFNLRARDAVSEARLALARVRAAQKRLSAADSSGDAGRRLATLEEQLATREGRYQQPMLVDQLNYLYSMTTQADQRVGRDAVERLAELRTELDARLAEVRAATGGAVAVGEGM